MAQMMLGVATAFIIFAYWLREGPLAAAALIFFAVAGGFFYDASTSAWDLFAISGFASIFGGGALSAMSMYLSRPKREEDEALDELDDEVELGLDVKGQNRRRRIRSNKRTTNDTKRAQSQLDKDLK